MKNVPKSLLLCGLLFAFLTTSGCGGPENTVPTASDPVPDGADGLSADDAERLRQLSEAADGDPDQ